MFNTRFLLLASVLLSLVSRFAYADNGAAGKEASALAAFAADIDMMHKKGLETSAPYTRAEPSKCTGAIDPSVTDPLVASAFKSWPGATKASGNNYSIPASDATALCDTYAQLRGAIVAIQKFPVAKDYRATRNTIDAKDYDRTMDVPDDKAGQICIDDVDAAIAAGAPHDVAVHFFDGDYTLDQVRESCAQHITDNAKVVSGVKASIAAENAEIAAIYQKAGIKGQRLALFAAAGKPEESGFYFAGCANGPTSAAQMKKAKKLFTWSEGDGGITVTKYVFQGDKVATSSRSFDRKEAAYRWCK